MPTRNLDRRHIGNWNLVAPGHDEQYEFTPESDEEKTTLVRYGFAVTDRKSEDSGENE